VGNYSSEPSGTTGSIYYDTSSAALKVYSGSAWSSIGSGTSSLAGVTAVGSGLTNGATLTTNNYLQLGSASSSSPGIIDNSTQSFSGQKTFTGSVTLGDSSSDVLTVNAGATFTSYLYGTTGTFTNSVTIGDASTDVLTVNANSIFGASANFNSYLIGTTGKFTGSVTIGDASSDVLKVNAEATFKSDLNGTTGTFSKTVTAGAFNSTSDYRVKENIQDLNLNIYNVNPLRPVNYYNNRLNKLDIGFIAHEVQEYYPFLVSGVKDGEETQSMNYSGLIGILVKEIQELKQRVKQLEDDFKNK